VQHWVPGFVYATKNGALLFVKDVIGTFSMLISSISIDPEVTCPHQFVYAIQKHLDNHSKDNAWEIIAQWVYIDLTFLFQCKIMEPFAVDVIPGLVVSVSTTALIPHLMKWEYVLSDSHMPSEKASNLTGVKDGQISESLTKRASSIQVDPNIAAYPLARVRLGTGAKAGFEYAKAVLGNICLTFEGLYKMHLEYLRGWDKEELGLLHLRKLLARRAGVWVIYNVGPRLVYSTVQFEHTLCKIY
jgi:hypothetical protein